MPPDSLPTTSGSVRRNLTCLLPDGHIPVTYWAKHPCDDALYLHEAWAYGPSGRVGFWYPNAEHTVTGQQMYEAWRGSMKRTKRGLNPEPRWKDLKPWLKRVWDRAAASLSTDEEEAK